MSSGLEMVCNAMEKHGVRKLVVQVGGFTLLEGDVREAADLLSDVVREGLFEEDKVPPLA